MTLRRSRFVTLLLVILPSSTLIIGAAQIAFTSASGWPPAGRAGAALMVAGIAPLLAAITLWRLAAGFDAVLVSAAAMLTSIGTIAMFGLSAERSTDQAFFATVAFRHGLFIGAGFLALVIGALLARRIDRAVRYPYTLLILALLLTTTTVVLGDEVNGARLWLQLGPVRFQPSEVARLLLVGFVAVYLYERRYLIASPWRIGPFDLPPAPYLLPIAGAVLAAAGVLMLQNDLGMAALIVLGAFASVAAAIQSRAATVAAGSLIALTAVAAFVAVPRVGDRVRGWLDPWDDPMGRGFQFIQADFGLAAGGVAGFRGSASRVPEVQTDFVLIAIGSQFGLVTGAAVLAISTIVVVRCVMNALRASRGFGAILASSLSALFGLQIILIAGGTLRVIPLTGLTFPLVSYGGTSMVATLFSLGLIVGIGAIPGDSRSAWT